MHGSRIIADASIEGLSARTGIGFQQLRFSVHLSSPAWTDTKESAILEHVSGRVFLEGRSGSRRLIGVASPEVPISIKTSARSSNTRLLFDLDLTSDQIWEIERFRDGGDLLWTLDVVGLSRGPHGDIVSVDTARYGLSISQWAAILDQLDLADVLVLGISIPRDDPKYKQFAACIEMLKRAHRDLAQGMYDSVVSRCRQALESISVVNGERKDVAAAVQKYKTQPKLMTKIERELMLSEAARHYMHLAHHVDEDGIPEWYSRNDATFILALSAAAVMSASTRLADKGAAPALVQD